MKETEKKQKEISKKLLSSPTIPGKKKRLESARIGNLLVFPKKGLFHLSRNGRSIVFWFSREGHLMIKIKGYDGYHLNYKKWEIYSDKSKKVLTPVKNAAVKSFELYRNGVKEVVPFFKIIQQHWPEIEMNYIQN